MEMKGWMLLDCYISKILVKYIINVTITCCGSNNNRLTVHVSIFKIFDG
jgi:hypothetical protein